jgi:hypothetical protein
MQFDRLAWTKLRGRCAPNSALVYSLKQAHKSHPFRNARRIERQLRLLRHLHSAAQSASPRFLARSRSRRGVTVGCAIAARAGRQSQRIGAQCRRSARREIPVESEDRSCPCPLQARGQTPEERGGPIHPSKHDCAVRPYAAGHPVQAESGPEGDDSYAQANMRTDQ